MRAVCTPINKTAAPGRDADASCLRDAGSLGHVVALHLQPTRDKFFFLCGAGESAQGPLCMLSYSASLRIDAMTRSTWDGVGISAYPSTSQFITEEYQGRNLSRAGIWRQEQKQNLELEGTAYSSVIASG